MIKVSLISCFFTQYLQSYISYKYSYGINLREITSIMVLIAFIINNTFEIPNKRVNGNVANIIYV